MISKKRLLMDIRDARDQGSAPSIQDNFKNGVETPHAAPHREEYERSRKDKHIKLVTGELFKLFYTDKDYDKLNCDDHGGDLREEAEHKENARERFHNRDQRSPELPGAKSHLLKPDRRLFAVPQFRYSVHQKYRAEYNAENEKCGVAEHKKELNHRCSIEHPVLNGKYGNLDTCRLMLNTLFMRILAIETSCDETALALLEATGRLRTPRFEILGNVISSQIEIHRPWGGVVPNLAKREHLKNLPIVLKAIMDQKLEIRNKDSLIHNSKFLTPDVIAVTVGPGLEPALWTGVNFAKELYKDLRRKNKKLKLIGVNHLEGHLYSFLLAQKTEFSVSSDQFSKRKLFPAIALIVSGGHTILLKMDSLTKWKKLGETRDDAVGEAFDKVAKMLGLPYPGGPEIQRLAREGNPKAIEFPRPMIHDKNYDFSYSGLKTSVLYYLRDREITPTHVNPSSHPRKSAYATADVAASFQEAALDVLVKKIERAVKEFNAKSVLLSGGVAANEELRKKLSAASNRLGVKFIAPPMDFNTDNAVMIGVAGYISHLRKKNRRITAQANLSV